MTETIAYTYGQPVLHICATGCGTTKTINYRPSRFDNWICHSCKLKRLHADGHYKNKIIIPKMTAERCALIGNKASKKWDDLAYRLRWSITRQSTRDKRIAFSKALWADSIRLTKLSDKIKLNWTKSTYRKIKTIQSQQLWEDQEYRAKQKAGYTSQIKEKMAVARANQPRISSLQIQLYKYLDDLGVAYYKEGTATAIGYYAFDCLIPTQDGRGILIECQGDYWHSFDKAKQNDRSKFTYINKYFPQYEIMYLWEHEFGAHGRILDRLKLKLGIEIETINYEFSQLELRTPSTIDLKQFLDSYHYIGTSRGGTAIGAYYNNELIGCVVFSSPLRQNTASQFGLTNGQIKEMSRVCIHPSYHKKNFSSWLIAKALKLIDCDLVISYCDTTVGHTGTIYKASNFKLHHEVDPDYWYVDSAGYVIHKRTLYGKASKMSMRENEYAEQFGYNKIYGGKKLCFIRYLNQGLSNEISYFNGSKEY